MSRSGSASVRHDGAAVLVLTCAVTRVGLGRQSRWPAVTWGRWCVTLTATSDGCAFGLASVSEPMVILVVRALPARLRSWPALFRTTSAEIVGRVTRVAARPAGLRAT